MATYEIPLGNYPQSFSISLAGTVYQLTVLWRGTFWALDIADKDGNPLVRGIPLVCGLDLLSPYQYMGFAGSLYVQGDANAGDAPDFFNLGITQKLYFVTNE